MIKKVVKAILPIIPGRFKAAMFFYKERIACRRPGVISGIKGIFDVIINYKFVLPSNLKKNSKQIIVSKQFDKVLKKVSFNRVKLIPYFYPLDESVIRVCLPGYKDLVSLTPDYSKILTVNLTSIGNALNSGKKDDFGDSLVRIINSITNFSIRAALFYKKQKKAREAKIASYLERIVTNEPESLDEALQKILFFNALFWQNNHRLNGIGRMDQVLYPYYKRDIENGISEDEIRQMMRDFILTLGSNISYKSNEIVGDTGQVIFIGGVDKDGKQVDNRLTYLILEIFAELNLPDPKLILKANHTTSDELWDLAVQCISTGNGSPLIANEELIIHCMKEFGYSHEDSRNFGTSACWEPLVIGKSFDQNNRIENINALKPVLKVLYSGKTFKTYEEYEKYFFEELTQMARTIADQNKVICFEPSPLLSIWCDDCIEKRQDIAWGGAKYNYHGFLVVGLSNAVNSLLNIENLIFDKKLLSFKQCLDVLKDNFSQREDVRQLFLTQRNRFGLAEAHVVDLTNRVMNCIAEVVENTTINGQRAKLGFSSPAYIANSREVPATPDGRKAGEPLGVHISPVSKRIDIAEIFDFASKLDYSGCKINGNVVDFIVSEVYLKNKEKFAQILKSALLDGIYELQLNVLDAGKLIAAKADPRLYPDLIVRVWGFSAYFNDLPEEYKDHMIRRAQMYG